MRFETTPNPNAIKCVLDAPRTGAIISAGSIPEAAGDPHAEALLAIRGVTRVLLHTAFVTVSKEPTADWAPIKRAVKKLLAD
jgi:pyrimidine deaminase RibD-like protein